MPRKSDWIQQLEFITQQLREGAQRFPGELIDRVIVEQLFQVGSRQAIRILHQLGAQTVGGALLMSQNEMLAALEKLAQGEEVQIEKRRRKRLIQQLEQARKESRGRQVRIPVSESASFPDGIQLNSGKLEIQFQSPVELLQKMMRLAQLAAEDWNVFVERTR